MANYKDDLNLYPIIQTLLKNWKFIVFSVLLASGSALVFSLLQTRTYSATSTIVGTYRRPILTLSEEFSTVTNNGDAKNKNKAFLTIANSDAIALKVFEMFSEQLPDDMLLDNFQKRVQIADEGDAIVITASFESPVLSAEVANAWADETVSAIKPGIKIEC